MPRRHPGTPPDQRTTYLYWLGLLLILLFVTFVRVRLLDFPLERDEGEYAYYGQLILQMISPFGSVYTMKLPGTGLSYAAIMGVFGQTIRGIHLGLLLVNCLAIVLLFVIVKKLLNPGAALISSSSYAVLSLGPGVFGFAAHATHFVVLFVLAGILMLRKSFARRTWPWVLGSGVLFGFSFLMKQPAAFFLLFGLSLLLVEECRFRPLALRTAASRVSLFVAGALLPLAAIVGVAYLSGRLDKFWFWTFKYAFRYASNVPLAYAWESFLQNFSSVLTSFTWLWGLGAAGLVVLFLDRRLRGQRAFLLSLLLFSLLSVCPGFYFRRHYFITLLPVLAILIALAFDYSQYLLVNKLKFSHGRYLLSTGFLFLVLMGLYAHKDYFFSQRPETLCRQIYRGNLCIESIKISEFLQARTDSADKIAVIGSEPQIYFYSHRQAATGYIYTYGLMESQPYNLAMQKEMAAEIEKAEPKYLIYVNSFLSWLPKKASPTFIFSWFENYTREHYDRAGVADMLSIDQTNYVWLQDAKDYQIKSKYYLVLYERKK
jgi:hypothetical protein